MMKQGVRPLWFLVSLIFVATTIVSTATYASEYSRAFLASHNDAFSVRLDTTAHKTAVEPVAQEAAASEEQTATEPPGLWDHLKVSGYLRFQGNGHYNFDMDRSNALDRSNDFMTVRSFINLSLDNGPFKAMFSLNLAGTEFDDGAFWGNDNPAQVRQWDASMQYLYVDYNGPVKARVGRMPAGFGNHIVAHTTRDGVRLAKSFDKVTAALVWFKGGEGRTFVEGADASLNLVNDSTGNDFDLDALVVPLVWKIHPNHSVQGVVARLFDSRADQGYPEKQFFDVNAKGTFGALQYKAEVALLRGQSPFNLVHQRRLDYRASLVFAQATYALSNTHRIGGTYGRGSGDTDPADDVLENFENLFMDETGYHFTYLFSDDIHGYTGRNSDLNRGSGFGNVTFYQVFGEADLNKDISLFTSFTVLRATEDRDRGTGIYGTNVSQQQTRSIGQEINLGGRIRLTPDSDFFLQSALFLPGKIFSQTDPAYKLEGGIALRF